MKKNFLLMVTLMAVTSLAPSVTAASPTLDMSRYEGKVVYLDFWASWCVPCRRSFPWMNAMQEKYADDGLVIVSVNVDAEPELADAFLQEFPASFEVIRDPNGEIASAYELLGMPNSFIFNRDGELVARHVGFRTDTPARSEALLQRLLAKQQNSTPLEGEQ